MKTMTKNIDINLTKALESHSKSFENLQNQLKAKLREVQEKLQTANQSESPLEYFKWLDFDYLKQANQKSKELADKLKSKFKNFFIIGMGGSGINSLVLKNSLYEFSNKSNKEFFVQNNLDPVSLLGKLEQVQNELEQTLFIVISKSGNTDEVKRNLSTIIDFYSEQDSFAWEKFAQQLVIITEPKQENKNNFLHQFKEELENKTQANIPWLENHLEVGGRFSMFSPVGMFAAEFMELESDKLIEGAEAMWQCFLQEEAKNNTVFKLACFDIMAARAGYQNRYSMVYADSLEALNKFRAQLKGESLNKNGIDSTVHIPGIGTVNHHSDLELLFMENNKLILEQVFFKQPYQDHKNKSELDCLKSLQGESNYQSLLDNHINPLFTYLNDNKVPSIQLIIEKQDEFCLGQFYMLDMLVTVTQAGLQDSENSHKKLDLAIRQHEVERYKKAARKK